MDNCYKKALRSQHGYLIDNVNIANPQLLETLVNEGVFTNADCVVIKSENTQADKIEKLLQKLILKDLTSLHIFKKALQVIGQENVVVRLDREILLEELKVHAGDNYEYRPGNTITQADFVDDVVPFEDVDISKILDDIHPGIYPDKDTVDVIRNIKRKVKTYSETVEQKSKMEGPMDEWSNNDVIAWLRTTKPPIKEEYIIKIKQMELTGIVLEDLKVAEIKELFPPDIPVCVSRQVLLQRDKFKRQHETSSSQQVSTSPVSSTSSTLVSQDNRTSSLVSPEDSTRRSLPISQKIPRDRVAKLHSLHTQVDIEATAPTTPSPRQAQDCAMIPLSGVAKLHSPVVVDSEFAKTSIQYETAQALSYDKPISQDGKQENIYTEVSSHAEELVEKPTVHPNNERERELSTCNETIQCKQDVAFRPLNLDEKSETSYASSDLCFSLATSNEVPTVECIGDTIPEVVDGTTYRVGDTINDIVNSEWDLLAYVKVFSEIDFSKPDTRVKFASEPIKFIGACLNARQNGMFYFGVSAWDHGDIKRGQITGVTIGEETDKYETYLHKAVQKCFQPEQLQVIQQCYQMDFLRLQRHHEDIAKYIVVFTVTPNFSLSANDIFFITLPKLPKEKSPRGSELEYEDPELYVLKQSGILKLGEDQLDQFIVHKHELSSRRKKMEHEAELTKDMNIEMSRKLTKLLCEYEEKIPNGIFHILVLGPCKSVSTEHFDFIKKINWQAVFDFDSHGYLKSSIATIGRKYIRIFEEVADFTVRSAKNIDNPDRLVKIREEFRQSSNCPWIFANGLENSSSETYDVGNWVRRRKQAWKETLQFFSDEMGEPRVKVVFMFLSGDNEIMVDAAEDLLTVFPEYGICLADNSDNISDWKQELIRRKRITPDEIDDMCVTGMPWVHTNKVILDCVGESKLQTTCCLPTASGELCYFNDELRTSLYDLDIVSINECDETNLNPRELSDYSHKKEDDFYKGHEVSWWNFAFEDHVMPRDVCTRLRDVISKELRKQICDEDGYVSRVVLSHQPGAGGTTLGKQILWGLRKMYRCAVISHCTDPNETKEQIFTFRSEHDQGNPKPVLLLLDNIEDEKVANLMAEIEEKSKIMNREYDGSSGKSTPVVCLFLQLVRVVDIPESYGHVKCSNHFSLSHSLSPKERTWLNKKYTSLEDNFTSNKERLDPKLLISFNIMKSGFSIAYVQKLTKTLLGEVKDGKERMLLKYISAINTFDLSFRKLPTSAFDTMMMDLPYSPGPRRGRRAKSLRWESNLSAGVRTLINEHPEAKQSFAFIHSIRISNELLAREVFSALKNERHECTTDVYKELLSRRDIFNVKSFAKDELLNIINDVLKKRDRGKTGVPRRFSPVVMDMKEREDVDKCVSVLEAAYSLNQDIFLAQQIARLFIDAENWEHAKTYGSLLVEKSPERSCLWDTYARVFLKWLTDKFKSIAYDRKILSSTEAKDIISYARKAIENFEMEQTVSLKESKFQQLENNAGLYGVLVTIQTLVDCLPYMNCFNMDKEQVHTFLVDDEYIPEGIRYLSDVQAPDDHLKFLKTMKDKVAICLCKLEDESVQRKEEIYTDNQASDLRMKIAHMRKLATDLSATFCEVSSEDDETISEESKCENRRRKLFRVIGGYSPTCIFRIEEYDKLDEIIRLTSANINSICHATDLLISITAKLALSALDVKSLESYLYEDVSEMSVKLYEKRSTLNAFGRGDKQIFLDPYLYYVMFNWPRKKQNLTRITPIDMKHALTEWKEAYFQKYPQQRFEKTANSKRETTNFFLAYGTGLNGYRTHRRLKENQKEIQTSNVNVNFWRNPKTIRELERFTGKLINEGREVQVPITYGTGNKDYITIPASFPVRNPSLYNKQVYFVMGFSWKSPKAYDISLSDPGLDPSLNIASNHRVLKPQRSITGQYRPEYQDRIIKLQQTLKTLEELKQRIGRGLELNQREAAMVRNEKETRRRLARIIEDRASVDF